LGSASSGTRHQCWIGVLVLFSEGSMVWLSLRLLRMWDWSPLVVVLSIRIRWWMGCFGTVESECHVVYCYANYEEDGAEGHRFPTYGLNKAVEDFRKGMSRYFCSTKLRRISGHTYLPGIAHLPDRGNPGPTSTLVVYEVLVAFAHFGQYTRVSKLRCCINVGSNSTEEDP